MTTGDTRPGAERVRRTAELLHERDCPGDEPLHTRSVIHRHVHESDALRILRRSVKVR